MPNTINWSKLIKHIKVNNASPSFISKEKLQSLPEKVMKLSFGTVIIFNKFRKPITTNGNSLWVIKDRF